MRRNQKKPKPVVKNERCIDCGLVMAPGQKRCLYCKSPTACHICKAKKINHGAKKCHLCGTPYSSAPI